MSPPHSLKRTRSHCAIKSDVPTSNNSNAAVWDCTRKKNKTPIRPPRTFLASLVAYEPHVLSKCSAATDYCSRHSLVTIDDNCNGNENGNGNDNDDVSAAQVVALVLEYLQDMAQCCHYVVSLSFAELRHLLQSFPFAMRHMHHIVKDLLGQLSWPLVTAIVHNVAAFICDDDLRDASVGELAAFLETWKMTAPSGNVCANVIGFFQDALQQFKHFLTTQWLQSGRLGFPCEFGKKSDVLFLCMECHREHM